MILKQDLSNHQDIKFWTRCFFFLIFEKTFVNLLTSRIRLWFIRKWAPSRSNFFLSLEITVFLNISFLNMFCCSYKFKIKFFFIARNINISAYFLSKKHIVIFFYKFKFYKFVIYFIKYNILPMTCDFLLCDSMLWKLINFFRAKGFVFSYKKFIDWTFSKFVYFFH